MNPDFLRVLVRQYMEATSKKEALKAFMVLEFYLLAHLLEEYRNKNGHDAPKNYENSFDLGAAAETAIMVYGGEIWHEE